MNESTLVPREEMNDLDWMARNVHAWPSGDHQPWCYVYMAHDGVMKASGNFLDAAAKPTMITIDQWLTRRAELQNKPSWGSHEYKVIAQGRNGSWYGSNYSEEKFGHESSFCIIGTGWNHICDGVKLGDWRDTLEKRPADLSEQAVTARLQEAADNVLAAAHELMTDKYKFEPFASVEDAKLTIMQSDGDVKHFGGIIGRSLPLEEDAATAKQPAPKGSGNPILGMVLADLTNRALEGKEKYGEPLLAHNGRNPLWDAYQEALDLAMYLRQAIEEQK